MTRPLSYKMQRAILDGDAMAMLAEIDHPSGVFRCWTGIGELLYSGVSFGLDAKYYNTMDLTGPVAYRGIENPYFDFPTNGSPRFGVNDTQYSAAWEGGLVSPITGTLTVGISVDDGGRLYLRNQLVIDQWILQPETLYTTTISAKKGEVIPIRFEYFENLGRADAKLVWSYSGGPIRKIPTTSLKPQSDNRIPWKGIGVLGTVAPIQSTSDLSIQEITFGISGIDSSALKLLENNVRNREGTVWLACLDDRGLIVPTPYQLLNATLDYQVFAVDPDGKALVQIIARSGFYTLTRALNDVWSNEDHQKDFPDDTGLGLVHTLENQQVRWTKE